MLISNAQSLAMAVEGTLARAAVSRRGEAAEWWRLLGLAKPSPCCFEGGLGAHWPLAAGMVQDSACLGWPAREFRPPGGEIVAYEPDPTAKKLDYFVVIDENDFDDLRVEERPRPVGC